MKRYLSLVLCIFMLAYIVLAMPDYANEKHNVSLFGEGTVNAPSVLIYGFI